MGKYDDIIDLPHHQSSKHPHMSMHDRAAQFAPFAALVGYDDAIEDTARHDTEGKLDTEYMHDEADRAYALYSQEIEFDRNGAEDGGRSYDGNYDGDGGNRD